MVNPENKQNILLPPHPKILIGRIRDDINTVRIDHDASEALTCLNNMTSIPWENLQRELGLDWPQTCKAIALLSAARLCDLGPSGVRVSVLGDEFLSKVKK